MSERVTLKMIAARAGVHYSTVSLALNNHPSLPQATRTRIQEIAQEMGWRPDPALSALVAYRTHKRRTVAHGVLAWVDLWSDKRGGKGWYPALWAGAQARAAAKGWALEVFNPVRQGIAPERFSKMLHSRGIVGVLIPPLPGEGGKLELDWERFSCVTVGSTLLAPRLHRIMPHHFHNIQMLMARLRAAGCRRIGFVLETTINERTLHYWSAAYWDAQFTMPKRQRMEPLFYAFTPEEEPMLLDWARKNHLDAVISTRANQICKILSRGCISVPGEVAVASVAFRTDTWEKGKAFTVAGVDEQFDAIGAIAVDTLVDLINRHERGIPEKAMQIMIEGRWLPGPTVPAG